MPGVDLLLEIFILAFNIVVALCLQKIPSFGSHLKFRSYFYYFYFYNRKDNPSLKYVPIESELNSQLNP